MGFKTSTVNIDSTSGYTSVYDYNEIIDTFDVALVKTVPDVFASLTDPPSSPIPNLMYPIGVGATGVWLGQDSKIGIYRQRENGYRWSFYTVPIGFKLTTPTPLNEFVQSYLDSSGNWISVSDSKVAYHPTGKVYAARTNVSAAFPNTTSTASFGRLFTGETGVFSPTYLSETILNTLSVTDNQSDQDIRRVYLFNWINFPIPTIPTGYIDGECAGNGGIYRLVFDNVSNAPFTFRLILNPSAGLISIANSSTKPFTQGTIVSITLVFTIPATNTVPYVIEFQIYRTLGSTAIIAALN
jgi:hypothetical protein